MERCQGTERVIANQSKLIGGNVELPCPKLFQAFSVKFTLIFFHECVHSIIPHQHMQKVLMQNCDFESTLKSRLRIDQDA